MIHMTGGERGTECTEPSCEEAPQHIRINSCGCGEGPIEMYRVWNFVLATDILTISQRLTGALQILGVLSMDIDIIDETGMLFSSLSRV